MRICVVGAGYVGLATAVMFGKLGHEVVCADKDRDRVKTVRSGKIPFHEPYLERELAKLVKKRILSATDAAVQAVEDSNFVFICVQTPSLSTGRIDTRPVKSASKTVGKGLRDADDYKVVVMKSTVVPSTTDSVVKPIVEEVSGKRSSEDFGLCMNPEFLQEGRALKDSMQPSRIVVGSEDRRAGNLLMGLYESIAAPKIITDLRSAEMIKYASNTALATRISFANEIANICVRIGIDSEPVLRAVGMDPRIGPLFLKPGLGFGGSCLPKDVRALLSKADSEGYKSSLLASILSINEMQPLEGVRLLESAIGDLAGKRIAVLGLAFKGGVDDIRETRAVPLIRLLRSKGAKVVAYDPMAMGSFKKVMPRIEYAASAAECIRGVDGCIVQADWPEFKRLGSSAFRKMKNPVVVDGRRFMDPGSVKKSGAKYLGIGYGTAGQQ
ncbi:MAG: hypothetical protein A3K60_03220 [Euryarchaeota archaeon RBG_19FT_COMBO_56_21]|nr:MAG: hypothetical protein A3K60_03220 [Euryarchaeota archaeon RBG_19FT_COMBO_56_21]